MHRRAAQVMAGARWPARPRGWLLLLACLLPLAAAGESLYVTASALFEGRAMLSIDGRTQLLRAGETSPEGVTLVSASATQAVVEIGGRRQTLLPGRHTGGGFAAPQRRKIAIPRNARHEYLVTGTINGRQVQLLVDTGANIVAMNGQQAQRLGIDYRRRGQPGQVQTAGGVVPAWSVMLERVELQGIVVHNVQASVIEGEFPVHVLLGMSWLGRVTMSEQLGVLYLEEK